MQIKRLGDQVAQLQKIIQQDDMKLMMMDFANTTQAELEAERGELQVALVSIVMPTLYSNALFADQTIHGGD
jgi:hypothetical protein